MGRRMLNGRTSLITCTIDGVDHLVSDEAAAEGVAARQGTYLALRGQLIPAAALTSPPGPLCSRCVENVANAQTPSTVQVRPRRRPRRSRLWQ